MCHCAVLKIYTQVQGILVVLYVESLRSAGPSLETATASEV